MAQTKIRRTPSAEVSRLIGEITIPLEEAINILYLMGISGSNSELHKRLLPVAEDKLQRMVQIVKHYH